MQNEINKNDDSNSEFTNEHEKLYPVDDHSAKLVQKKKMDFAFKVIPNETLDGKVRVDSFDGRSTRIFSNETGKKQSGEDFNCDMQNESLYLKKKREYEAGFSNGRWTKEEHIRFVEAILKYGNEWKDVQDYVKTRSSTQARSHAQKFFLKIKRCNLLNSNSKSVNIGTLCKILTEMEPEEYKKTMKLLNEVPYEKSKFGKESIENDKKKLKFGNLDTVKREVQTIGSSSNLSTEKLGSKLNENRKNVLFHSRKQQFLELKVPSKNISYLKAEALNKQKEIEYLKAQEFKDLENLEKMGMNFYNVGMNVNIFNFHPNLKSLPLNNFDEKNNLLNKKCQVNQNQTNYQGNPSQNHNKVNQIQQKQATVPQQKHTNLRKHSNTNIIQVNPYQNKRNSNIFSSRQNMLNFPNLALQETYERCINFKRSETDFEKIFLNTFNSPAEKVEHDDMFLERLCSVPFILDEEDICSETNFQADKLFS